MFDNKHILLRVIVIKYTNQRQQGSRQATPSFPMAAFFAFSFFFKSILSFFNFRQK